jgi:Tfp pilus assembly protein PilF
VRTLTVLGRAYFDAGQMSQAEKAFKAAGSYDEAMLLLGQLYQQMGKSGQARKTYEKFLEIHGDHPKAEWVRKLLQAL